MDFDFAGVEEILDIKIEDKSLFQTAFTHRSYLNEHQDYSLPSNERLEFLGDAVLQLVSSKYLYNKYPDQPEGKLTNYRAATVCTTSLAEESERLNYGKYLLLSNGEDQSGGRTSEYILANTFEAVLGALYIEKGIEFCHKFIEKELLYKIEDIVKNELYKDPKSKFQEKAQELRGITPNYEVLESWGADHERTFKVGVYLEKQLYGEGIGSSKQKAQQEAAQNALDKLENV
ncbi:MAG: ribonuclease III [Patescibacteria group bacterium]|uniref:Ribonuclease 3 n=1 Tax=candidate division WWE3 bacterium TaxID=2053526 RepID=A0A955ECP9_UNCKA|nr:ribonuclease III [candidate division WWE3 bacterium]